MALYKSIYNNYCYYYYYVRLYNAVRVAGFNAETGRLVAVKRMKGEAISGARHSSQQQFQNEINVLSSSVFTYLQSSYLFNHRAASMQISVKADRFSNRLRMIDSSGLQLTRSLPKRRRLLIYFFSSFPWRRGVIKRSYAYSHLILCGDMFRVQV